MTEGENDYPSVTCGDSALRRAVQERCRKGERYMKATGIVGSVDDFGRIVIPKEIRRILKIGEGAHSLTTLTPIDRFCWAIHTLAQRITAQ